MTKKKPESHERKEKKQKRSEIDGVKKSKSEKKLKLNENNVIAALQEITKNEKEKATPQMMGSPVSNENEKEPAIPRPIGSLVPFANPLADEKITKKVLKIVKKSSKNKTLKRGVKEVVKAVRKLQRSQEVTSAPGVVVLAADISPMDVISHIPVLCEDHNVPYIFVRSRAELGSAGNTKRPTSVVMVTESRVSDEEGFKEAYQKLVTIVEKEARRETESTRWSGY